MTPVSPLGFGTIKPSTVPVRLAIHVAISDDKSSRAEEIA